MDDESRPLILVIDDEETIRDGCRLALAKYGYRVLTSGDGHEGIHLAREQRPELAFVDLKMPHISGMEVINVLTVDVPETVLVVITGYATIGSAVEAMKKGVYDYLPKPFSPDQLRVVANRALEHRNLKIETARLRAEKLQMERNFITFVSHEMRSPLVTIRQYLEALKTMAHGRLGAEALEVIERCNKRAQNLEGLVEHWLDFSRIDDGSMAQGKKPLQLAAIVAASIEELAPLCEKRGLTVRNHLPAELPPIDADEESIYRVMTNIIGNATKYTPSGGEISVRGEADEHYVRLSITDTGEGIPADKLPFIFEPFYRVKGKQEKHRGSGLGLTFCKRIIEAHGGVIEVASQLGAGTTLTITIPR